MALRGSFRYLNQYDMHKKIVNEFFLQKPGDSKVFQRDTSKDKRDCDVIRENHKFLWEEDDKPLTWEQEFAKKYYDRLFKEYCIADLSHYKENKIAMRWRIEKEVINGKGQFICGNKKCTEERHLRTWEVNFGYLEEGIKKNALVKLRLCPECSLKLNYHSQKKEVKRLKNKKQKSKSDKKYKSAAADDENEMLIDEAASASTSENNKSDNSQETILKEEENPWTTVKTVETKSREEEMEEYLDELFL